MIERQFIAQKMKEFSVKNYIEEAFPQGGISQIKLKKIPLGEKIIISTSRPSMVVGSKGANIKDLTRMLKKKFHLENPQIEITEIKDIFLDATLVAQRIAGSLERFGSGRFKSIGHKAMENVIKSGALGVEIILSGRIPSSRARSWRFYQGYLKKCGDVSVEGVKKAQATALLKSGVIGIKVAIMPPDVQLPDRVEVLAEAKQEEVKLPVKEEEKKRAGKREKSSSGKKRSASSKKVEKKKNKEVKIEEFSEEKVPSSSEEKVLSSPEEKVLSLSENSS